MKALNRQDGWPSFGYQVSELSRVLLNIVDWRLVYESRCANRGAFLIAQSVTQENRLQSYVAQGHPCWLSELFDCEKG